MSRVIKIISSFFIAVFIINSTLASTTNDFSEWLNSYKKFAHKEGVSQTTLDISLKMLNF